MTMKFTNSIDKLFCPIFAACQPKAGLRSKAVTLVRAGMCAGALLGLFGARGESAAQERCGAETAKLATLSHTVTFGSRGAVSSLTTAGGVRFISEATHLFELELRETTDFTHVRVVRSHDAKSFKIESIPGGLLFHYADFGALPLKSASCRVRADGEKLRWRLSVEPAEGWAVDSSTFPRLALVTKIGADGADDVLVSGHTGKAGVQRNPGAAKWNRIGREPGWLGAQLAVYCDPRALLLYCAEDARGEAKTLSLNNALKGRINFAFSHLGWMTTREEMPYDIVTCCLDAKDGDEPISWHDGADIYRAWAEKQSWCKMPYRDRKDLPLWLKTAPVHGNLYDWRGWCNRTNALEDWAEKFWAKNFPGTTLNLHFDGWERDGVYVMTDYFPLYPTDAAFANHAAKLEKRGILLFPWPSGYHRASAYDRRTNGTFRVDERETFDRVFVPHACKNPDGSIVDRKYRWLKGGIVTSLCGGDPWTVDWFTRDICGRIASLGVPTVSGDQNIGGGFPPCWDRSHPHPPGQGRWVNEVARRQALDVLDKLREHHPKTAAFCEEGANEFLNDVVSFSYTREAYDEKGEWTSVFTYLYHEYLPIFPSLGGVGRLSDAYCLVSGLMPRIKPKFSDYDDSLRKKERPAETGKSGSNDPKDLWLSAGADDDNVRNRFLKRWIALFSDEAKEWLMFGRRIKPPLLKCRSVKLKGRNVPVVFVGAYRSLEGEKALIFASGSPEVETVTYLSHGKTQTMTMQPYAAEIVRVQ